MIANCFFVVVVNLEIRQAFEMPMDYLLYERFWAVRWILQHIQRKHVVENPAAFAVFLENIVQWT